ncbi:MAG: hypothetical protein HOP30_13770 [Cyclobacteriaceae bacterium]|nr:hypothetical protein [Cyclobacteriaceae bacterium]
MDRQEEVKIKVFRVIEEQWPLAAFEAWLYDQNDLADQMNDSLILELFAFNYRHEGALHAFRDVMLHYYDQKDFMLWKLKVNLQDLIDGKDSQDRILRDFLRMSYSELPFLQNLGFYVYYFEDLEYAGLSKKEMITRLKEDATVLLRAITTEQAKNPNFDIYKFELRSN